VKSTYPLRESVRLERLFHDVTSRTRSQVAKNLSAVNAYPIETGMGKDIAIKLNINDRILIECSG
jgi:hypothetical protein